MTLLERVELQAPGSGYFSGMSSDIGCTQRIQRSCGCTEFVSHNWHHSLTTAYMCTCSAGAGKTKLV